jgi:hypothetical protein
VIVDDGGGAFPTTPSALIGQFNSLGPAQMPGLWITAGPDAGPSTRTVVADGTSPTGFRLTSIQNLANPSAGQHIRPDSGHLVGVPCLAAGELTGEGLEIPAGTADPFTTGATDATPTTPTIPGSGGLFSLFSDRTKGFSFGFVGLLRDDFTFNPASFRIGEDADANKINFADRIMFEQAISNSAVRQARFGHPLNGSTLLHCMRYMGTSANSQSGKAWGFDRVGRDILILVDTESSADFLATGRRIRFNVGVGTSDTRNAKSLFYALSGRPSRAQTKLLQDYFKLKYPALVEDTSPLAFLTGSSFMGYRIDLLQQGQLGSPAANGGDGDVGIIRLAVNGREPKQEQYPFTHFLEDLDFSKRSDRGVAIIVGEELNSGTQVTNPEPNALTQNYFWASAVRAVDTRAVRTALNGLTWLDENSKPSGATRLTDHRANAVPTYADAFVDVQLTVRHTS